MKPMRITRAASRRGRRVLADLESRSQSVLDAGVMRRAGAIVAAVRAGGDRKLLAAVRRYDRVAVSRAAELRLDPRAGESSESVPVGFPEALERAIAAVERFHSLQARPGYRLEESGMELEERRVPLRRIGIYVPGGRAAYPSTVVMTAVPARLAGVDDIAVATPMGSWQQSPALRYTLARLGVREVWGMGGAHAVAALAYGTESVERVDKIVGPGNAWVTAAKALVARDVGIDQLAGPSEVVVLASGGDPELIASDLLAQAEHDPWAAAVMVTTDRDLARRTVAAVGEQLAALPAPAVAAASLRRFGWALLVPDLRAGIEVVDRLAPEHLQLVGEEAETLAGRSWPAGAVFVGSSTPEVFGDYLAGPSHVLPTGGSARYASGLGVDDFVRRFHVVRCSPGAASRWAASAVALAEAEGLAAHAAAALKRL